MHCVEEDAAVGKVTRFPQAAISETGYDSFHPVKQEQSLPKFGDLGVRSRESSRPSSPQLNVDREVTCNQHPAGVLNGEDGEQMEEASAATGEEVEEEEEEDEEDWLEWDVQCMGVAWRCPQTTNCENRQCIRGHEIISRLFAALGTGEKRLSEVKREELCWMYGLITHAMRCSDMEHACTVPLCSELNAIFPGEELGMKDKLDYMMRVFGQEPIITDTMGVLETKVSNFPGGKPGHEEKVDFVPYHVIRKLGDLVLSYCQPLNGPGMTYILHRSARNCRSVLDALLKDPLPDCPIVQHHWCMYQGFMHYVAKDKYDRLLTPEVFKELCETISLGKVVHQLATIAAYIRSRGAVLLDWSAENFSVDAEGCIKLYDATNCMMLEDLTDESDVSCAARSIPPQFVPPEMWVPFMDPERSTMWGLGILLYYLATGKFHVDLHQPLERMRRTLKCGLATIDMSDCADDVKFVLSHWCLKETPRDRRSPERVAAITAEKEPVP